MTMANSTQNSPGPVKYLSIGHQSQDIHIGPDGERSEPEHGGTSLYAGLTAWLLTGERVAVVSSTSTNAGRSSRGPDSGALETYADPDTEQTVFEDWRDGDSRLQKLVSRAPSIDSSLGALGQRGRNASTVFAGPLLDELPLDCRSWFWCDFACLIPQGWFRRIGDDGLVTLEAPDVSCITGPWDLVVLSEDEARAVEKAGQMDGWKRLARVLAVTRGSRGATVYAEGGHMNVDALKPDRVVDTTGAGDVWSAAFTIRFNETRSITESARYASAAAAICVSRKGLRGVPESRIEIENMLSGRGT